MLSAISIQLYISIVQNNPITMLINYMKHIVQSFQRKIFKVIKSTWSLQNNNVVWVGNMSRKPSQHHHTYIQGVT